MTTKQHIYTEQEAYQKLSALCAAAEYCEADIRKKMRNWIVKDPSRTIHDGEEELAHPLYGEEEGGNDEVKDRIIARLFQERFLDDMRYATSFVHDKFRYNHWGRVRISQELRMRNIPTDIINVALEEIPEEEDLETLRHLIESKKKSVKGKSEYDIRCKLVRFALGRGFQMDDILKCLDLEDE